MNKIATLIILLLAFMPLSELIAQGFYLKASAGYGLPVSPSIIGQQTIQNEDQTANSNTSVTKTKNVTGSFGGGLRGLLGVGYMFNKILGAEINIQYSSSKTYETKDEYHYQSDDGDANQHYISKLHSRAILINPAFVIYPGAKLPYARFGFVIGSPTIKNEDSYHSDIRVKDERSIKGETKTNLTLGFQGALGMKWTVASSFDVFTEVSVISMTAYTKSFKLTEYIDNGQDGLASVRQYYKQTKYVKSLEVDNLMRTDYTKPQEVIREERAFSSIGLNVGVIYLLNKRNTQ